MIPAPPSRPLPPGARLRPLRAADLEEVARLEAGRAAVEVKDE